MTTRIVVRLNTNDTADLILAARAVRLLEESGRAFTEVEYGDPVIKRAFVHKTKAGFLVVIEGVV